MAQTIITQGTAPCQQPAGSPRTLLVEATGMLGKLVVLVVLASAGASMAGVLKGSEEALLLGGCWMVCTECPSADDSDGCPS